jgi:hypothetical protein
MLLAAATAATIGVAAPAQARPATLKVPSAKTAIHKAAQRDADDMDARRVTIGRCQRLSRVTVDCWAYFHDGTAFHQHWNTIKVRYRARLQPGHRVRAYTPDFRW